MIKRQAIACFLISLCSINIANGKERDGRPEGDANVDTLFKKVFDSKNKQNTESEASRVIASQEPRVEAALATKARSSDPAQQAYAVVLLCMRARFFPRSAFPLPELQGGFLVNLDPAGDLSPFEPNFDRLEAEGREAVERTLHSSNEQLKKTVELYCGVLAQELRSVPADNLVKQWRAAIMSLPQPYYYNANDAEPYYRVRVLQRTVVEKGLKGAEHVAQLLKAEKNPVARELEVELIRMIDSDSYRLRGSSEGRQVIDTVDAILASKNLAPAYKLPVHRQELRLDLRKQFLQDDFPCNFDTWTNAVALAFERFHNDFSLIPAHSGGLLCNSMRVSEFVRILTDVDPSFPSWEFASTGTQQDILHPKFRDKIARYHAAYTRRQ